MKNVKVKLNTYRLRRLFSNIFCISRYESKDYDKRPYKNKYVSVFNDILFSYMSFTFLDDNSRELYISILYFFKWHIEISQ